MFVALERLLVKVRQPAARADQLIELRRRVRAERACVPDDEERELAVELRARKLEVAAELDAVTSCSSCGLGMPRPFGHHAGGACCSGVTANVFDDSEVASLVHAGTSARHLTPPARTNEPAGCAFRGAGGCSLAVAHRPARCVHFTCGTLRRELHARGRLDAIETKLDALDHAMRRFAAVHRARADRDVVTSIVDAVTASPARRPRSP
jgi:hypothetical protein